MRWDKKSVAWTLVLICLIVAVNTVTIWKYIALRSGGKSAAAIDFPRPDRIVVTDGSQNKMFERNEKEFDTVWQTCRKMCGAVGHVYPSDVSKENAGITVQYEYDRPKRGTVTLQRERKAATAERIEFFLTGEWYGTVWVDGQCYGGLPPDPDGIEYVKDLLAKG